MRAQKKESKQLTTSKWLVVAFFALVGGLLITRSHAAVNPNLVGDLNGDHIVDITDLSMLLTNWGKTDAAPPPPPTVPPPPGPQTLGVGGVVTPPDAILTTADSAAALAITTSGTADKPRVYDGQGHKIGSITITADWVVVQNFNVVASGQYGIYSTGTHVTIQNNDIKNIHTSGDGDLNAITFFGDYHRILYNTAIDFVSGDPGDSHTDAIQTWDTSSKRSSSNVTIGWNKFSGPDKSAGAPIHQCIMSEGPKSTDGGGGGSGASQNWLVIGNYFKDSWNQCLKFDDIDNVSVTQNEFAGNSSHVIEATALSTGFKYYSDNKVTGTYGSVGVTITSGPGPSTIP